MPELYITEKQTSGTDRWWVMHTLDTWPHKALVIKCPTKRCADALVSMLNDKQITEPLVRTVLHDRARASKHLPTPGTFAVDSFRHVVTTTHLVSIAVPEWWEGLTREIVDTYDPRSVPPCT